MLDKLKKWRPKKSYLSRLLLTAAILFGAGFATLSPSYRECVSHHQERANQEKANASHPESKIGIPENVFVAMDCEGEFLHANEGLLTALATIAIAFFTLSLRQSTDRLWEGGKEQLTVMQGQLTEMQQSFAAERAYVLKSEFKGTGVAPVPGAQVTFTFRNFGRTPADIRLIAFKSAYSLTGYPEIKASFDNPIFSDATGHMPTGSIIVEPGKDLGPFAETLVITDSEIVQARMGNGKIYCREVIVYDDMRGGRHTTSSCFSYNFGAPGWLSCPEEGATYHN